MRHPSKSQYKNTVGIFRNTEIKKNFKLYDVYYTGSDDKRELFIVLIVFV